MYHAEVASVLAQYQRGVGYPEMASCETDDIKMANLTFYLLYMQVYTLAIMAIYAIVYVLIVQHTLYTSTRSPPCTCCMHSIIAFDGRPMSKLATCSSQ